MSRAAPIVFCALIALGCGGGVGARRVTSVEDERVADTGVDLVLGLPPGAEKCVVGWPARVPPERRALLQTMSQVSPAEPWTAGGDLRAFVFVAQTGEWGSSTVSVMNEGGIRRREESGEAWAIRLRSQVDARCEGLVREHPTAFEVAVYEVEPDVVDGGWIEAWIEPSGGRVVSTRRIHLSSEASAVDYVAFFLGGGDRSRLGEASIERRGAMVEERVLVEWDDLELSRDDEARERLAAVEEREAAWEAIDIEALDVTEVSLIERAAQHLLIGFRTANNAAQGARVERELRRLAVRAAATLAEEGELALWFAARFAEDFDDPSGALAILDAQPGTTRARTLEWRQLRRALLARTDHASHVEALVEDGVVPRASATRAGRDIAEWFSAAEEREYRAGETLWMSTDSLVRDASRVRGGRGVGTSLSLAPLAHALGLFSRARDGAREAGAQEARPLHLAVRARLPFAPQAFDRMWNVIRYTGRGRETWIGVRHGRDDASAEMWATLTRTVEDGPFELGVALSDERAEVALLRGRVGNGRFAVERVTGALARVSLEAFERYVLEPLAPFFGEQRFPAPTLSLEAKDAADAHELLGVVGPEIEVAGGRCSVQASTLACEAEAWQYDVRSLDHMMGAIIKARLLASGVPARRVGGGPR